jgi:hypothetical protein
MSSTPQSAPSAGIKASVHGGVSAPAQARHAWALFLGFALTTASMLLLQQFLTRIFTILFNSGLAFLAISTTFLGLGAAGVSLVAFPRLFRAERGATAAPVCALLYALALVAGLVGLVGLDHVWSGPDGSVSTDLKSQIVRVVVSSVLMLPAMFLVGLVISLVLRANAARVGKLYGADLAGGGLGCLLVLPLMDWVGGDQGVFVIAGIAALGALLLAHAHGQRGARACAGVALLVFALLPLANRERALVDVRSHRTPLSGVDAWVDESRELGRKWNSLSRLGMFPVKGDTAIYVRIDSSCQTTVPALGPEYVREYVKHTDFERLPFVLDRHERYLEIGAGGGRGMVLAKECGARQITGVEINPGIVEAALGEYPGYGVASILAQPGSRYLAQEGRSFAQTCGEQFDTVTITFIQTGIAASSAAFALSEANLFTVEAFEEFLGLLSDDGVFYVYRHGGNEMLRLLAVAREALARHGIADPKPHMFVACNDTNRAALLIGKKPFSADEIAKLESAARELAVTVTWSPSMRAGELEPNPFPARVRELRASGALDMASVVAAYKEAQRDTTHASFDRTFLESSDPQAFLDDYFIDIRPTHDDRPYYFFLGINRLSDFALYFDPAGTGILGGTVVLLFWMAAAFAVLVGVLVLAPLLLRRIGASQRGLAWPVVSYFTGLGFGYIAVQISFVQRFVLFLGHPVYAISVVLLAFLLSSGLGSMNSKRLFERGFLTVPRVVLLLALLLVAYNFLIPAVFHSTLIGLPIAAKIAISVAFIFPLAFVMGLLFPQGIGLVDRLAPELVPWAWAANTASSVLGAILALVLAIHYGFTATALVGAAVYALLCIPSFLRLQRAARMAAA